MADHGKLQHLQSAGGGYRRPRVHADPAGPGGERRGLEPRAPGLRQSNRRACGHGAAPTWDYEQSRLVAQHTTPNGTNTSINNVPFTPQSHWAFSPLGHMVGGLATRYAVDQYHPDGRVLRIERVVESIPVERGEREDQEERVRWSMRQTQPDWKWEGAPIPETKPPFPMC